MRRTAWAMSGLVATCAALAFVSGCDSDDETTTPNSPEAPTIEATTETYLDPEPDPDLPLPDTDVPIPAPAPEETPDTDPTLRVPYEPAPEEFPGVEHCPFAGDPLCAPVTVPPPNLDPPF